ncbi:MAG: sodium:proton antiporter NhaD [gamma proteobacterium endosymbiont of Lamellibrachia anaximandri]|nr:sodium:proton antiporter NhaD [gamma proteobacterium endosymbiont of Lamellibrachia anaximandri]MBL3533520.1 sodium:proton antiporter NhaD [gamma proteobacterium endosymbiont of Lamellibrachia anaximandri]
MADGLSRIREFAILYRHNPIRFLLILSLSAFSAPAWAMQSSSAENLALQWPGLAAMAIFVLAILAVTFEEFIDMRKSKPMLLSAGLIWGLIAWSETHLGLAHGAEAAVRGYLLKYAELMLFLLVVMTYINAMNERRVFAALRTWVAERGYTYRSLFWLTGLTTFVLSPLLDNLSTALLMGAVVFALGRKEVRFTSLACVNVVVAANAGGVFSPFGDLTTLVIWQHQITTSQGPLDFWSFYNLLIPALTGYLLTALLLSRAIPHGTPKSRVEKIDMLRGGAMILLLFLLTIATSVTFETLLQLPPVIGMMTGLAYLQFFGYYLKKSHNDEELTGEEEWIGGPLPSLKKTPFDVFQRISRAEWDAILFLYGIALSVGGLAYIGWLSMAEAVMYGQWGTDVANLMVGFYSAIVENTPTMFAVLAMDPRMALGDWLTVTLTTGIGGSLLSIGSAAGIALMGQSYGRYTFFAHLRWTPEIMLGFFVSVLCHYWINSALF